MPVSTQSATSLAACLGSYAAFMRLLGRPGLPPGRWSAWDYLANDGAQGPEVPGPLDVGRVMCVGAGAVASALVVFASSIGLGGEWTFVDGDAVDLTNLNRQLAFRAVDAGWPDGQAVNKAVRLAAGVPGASASPRWYGGDADLARRPYDVVLPLANERGVRSDLAFRQATVMLHATTSASWQAQVHRHVAGYDDCLLCRLPGEAPRMKCSVGSVEFPRGGSGDAALPFLSATAGLLLLVQTIRLMTARLLESDHNFRAVDFGGESLGVQRATLSCRESCRSRLPLGAGRRIDSRSRWSRLGGVVDRS